MQSKLNESVHDLLIRCDGADVLVLADGARLVIIDGHESFPEIVQCFPASLLSALEDFPLVLRSSLHRMLAEDAHNEIQQTESCEEDEYCPERNQDGRLQ